VKVAVPDSACPEPYSKGTVITAANPDTAIRSRYPCLR